MSVMEPRVEPEAPPRAERIVVLNKGRIEQVGTPSEVYDRPATRFAAAFIGSSDRLPGRITAAGTQRSRVRLAAGVEVDVAASAPLGPGGHVVLSVRPERMRLASDPGPDRIPARLDVSMPLGPTVVHEVELADGRRIKVSEPRLHEAAARQPGDAVYVELRLEAGAAIFPDGLFDEKATEAWMARWRRRVRDYERDLDVSEAMIHVAMGALLVRRIAHP